MAKTALLFQPVLQFFDNSGSILNGGKLHFYEVGTTTNKDTYADSAKAVTNPNPVILDSAGRPDNSGSPIDIWLDGAYKIVLKDSSDNTIRTKDSVTALAEALGHASKSSDYTVLSTDLNNVISVDASGASRTVTLIAAATAGAGFTITVIKSDSSGNTVTIDGNSSETINGSATIVLSRQYDSLKLVCNGSNWEVVSRHWEDVIPTDGASGGTSVSQSTPGIFLSAVGMDAINKYTPAIKFGSSDTAFTTDKWFAGIAGNATEAYSANTDSGMGLSFFTTPDNAGASPSPTLAMTIDQDGNVSTLDGNLTVIESDSRTNSVDDVIVGTSTTSGTPAAGIGTGILLRAESADENPSDFGRISFAATDVTAGSEDTDCVIQTRTAGAALSDAFKFRVTNTSNYIITGAPSAERTITLPNNDATLGTGWEKISAQTASTSATLDFTDLSSTHRIYKFIITDIAPTTDNVNLHLLTSTDNGSSYDNGASDYSWIGHYISHETSPTTTNNGDDADSQIVLLAGLGTGVAETTNIELTIFNPSASKRTHIIWNGSYISQVPTGQMFQGSGARLSNTDVDAVRFVLSSGTIASGTISLYGLID